MSPPLKTPSTERDPIAPDPPLRYSSRHRITSGREDSEHGKRGRPRGDRRRGGLHKEPRELKRDRSRNEREGMATTREGRGRGREKERKGLESRAWGPNTMDRLGDSEMSRPTTLNRRRMRTLPQLDRRTMHPGRRMLTPAITWFNVGMDGFSGLLSASEPDRVLLYRPWTFIH